MFAGLITLKSYTNLPSTSGAKDYTEEEDRMKAKEAQCRSTTMQKAMATPAYSKPTKEVPLLESPNTITQRKARENFYRIAGQAQGLHVRF